MRTVLGVAVFFALAHREPRNFLPDFVGGAVMGYARIASGSLWPAIAVHAAFNTTSVVLALVFGPEVDVLSRGQNWAATALWILLGAAFLRFADKSERCTAARALDADGAP
jgi:membrane protease YdiL (CAAX protease family)